MVKLRKISKFIIKKITIIIIIIIIIQKGYINDYPTGRILRDAKLYEIGAGTSEVRRLIIGRALNDEYAKEMKN